MLAADFLTGGLVQPCGAFCLLHGLTIRLDKHRQLLLAITVGC